MDSINSWDPLGVGAAVGKVAGAAEVAKSARPSQDVGRFSAGVRKPRNNQLNPLEVTTGDGD